MPTEGIITGSLPGIINNVDNVYEGNLRYYFRKLFNEAKNLDNPYHNFRHLTHVLYLCYKAAKFYSERYAAFPKYKFRSLLIAAIFHDFDHPGRTGNDDLNIEIAIRAVRRLIHKKDIDLLPNIEYLIRCTEFPYKQKGDDIEFMAKILRDADAAQVFSVAWFQQVVNGLAAEMKMPRRTVLEMQESFLSNLNFNTEWAKAEFPPSVIEAKIAEAKALLEIIDDDDNNDEK